MQTGYRNGMADSAELQGKIRFIVQTFRISQQQRLCKGYPLLRKTRGNGFLEKRRYFPREEEKAPSSGGIHRSLGLLCAQKEQTVSGMVTVLFFSAGKCQPQKHIRCQPIPRFQRPILFQIQPNPVRLPVYPGPSADLTAVQTLFTGFPGINRNCPCFSIQLAQRRQIRRSIQREPPKRGGTAQQDQSHRTQLFPLCPERKEKAPGKGNQKCWNGNRGIPKQIRTEQACAAKAEG